MIQNKDNKMKFRQFLDHLGKMSAKQISRFVIGNPSVDYDSFFGSILLAYILTSTTGELHQPIIDCRRQELGLRFQIEAVLQKVKIDPGVFYFRESTKEKYLEGVYNLYDHNYREGISNVQFIVDHHAYSHNQIKASKYLIDTMGSGLTIIYYLLAQNRLKLINLEENHPNVTFLQKYNNFVKDTPFERYRQSELIDNDIKEIIRYGILIDSYNFDAKQKERWTIFDRKAVDFIEAEQKFDCGHQWIESLKFDKQRNKKMTLHQSLVKDRKQYTYGNIKATYSIIYLSPHEFYQNYHTAMATEFQATRQQSDIYFLMSLYQGKQGAFKREIIYKIKHKDQEGKIEQVLSKCFTSQKMIKFGKIEEEWHHWIDPSATMSRKKLEPLIKEALLSIKVINQI